MQEERSHRTLLSAEPRPTLSHQLALHLLIFVFGLLFAESVQEFSSYKAFKESLKGLPPMTMKEARPSKSCDSLSEDFKSSEPETWRRVSTGATVPSKRETPSLSFLALLSLVSSANSKKDMSVGSIRLECNKRAARGEAQKASVRKHREAFPPSEHLTEDQVRQQQLPVIDVIKKQGDSVRRNQEVRCVDWFTALMIRLQSFFHVTERLGGCSTIDC